MVFSVAVLASASCRGEDTKALERERQTYLRRQSIFDMRDFDFSYIVKSRQDAAGDALEWVVAENKPGPITAGDTRAIPMFHFMEGTLDIKSGVDREAAEAAIQYKVRVWTINVRGDRFAALWFANMEICVVNPTKEGDDRIGHIYLLPAGWENEVSAGWAYYNANKRLFDQAKAGSNSAQLKVLIQNKNRFIAVAAFRTLLDGQTVNAQWVRKAIFSTKGSLREVFEKMADRSVYKW